MSREESLRITNVLRISFFDVYSIHYERTDSIFAGWTFLGIEVYCLSGGGLLIRWGRGHLSQVIDWQAQ